VGAAFRDGTVKGFAVSTTSTSITEYVRLDASRTRLRFKYVK